MICKPCHLGNQLYAFAWIEIKLKDGDFMFNAYLNVSQNLHAHCEGQECPCDHRATNFRLEFTGETPHYVEPYKDNPATDSVGQVTGFYGG